jgi:proteasome activator subunit 4
LLGDDPFDAYKITIEKYITVTDKDKQRGAAELLAGVLGGKYSCCSAPIFTTYVVFQASKHWSVEKQVKMWNWFTPNITKIFKQNIKTDTLPVWTSFLEVRMDVLNPIAISQGFSSVYVLPSGSQKGTTISGPTYRWIQLR